MTGTARITAREIMQITADVFDAKVSDITGPKRDAETCRVRFAAVSLMRHHTGKSMAWIGRQIGRDHTSVLNAIVRCDILIESDPEFSAVYDAAEIAVLGPLLAFKSSRAAQ